LIAIDKGELKTYRKLLIMLRGEEKEIWWKGKVSLIKEDSLMFKEYFRRIARVGGTSCGGTF
jgi:hypothetical protein